MPPQEQADLWMALRDRMKNDWHELTLQERKAGTCTPGAISWLLNYPQNPLVRRRFVCPNLRLLAHYCVTYSRINAQAQIC